MMAFCEWTKCHQWAQWRVSLHDKTSRKFCQIHKDAYEKEAGKYGEENKEGPKYIFMGAMPNRLVN